MPQPTAYPSEFYPGEVYPGEGIPGPVILDESEWMLDGVRFGSWRRSGLAIQDCQWAEWKIAGSDTDRPGGHGVTPGRDWLRSAVISFVVGTSDTASSPEALAVAGQLVSAWTRGLELPRGKTMPLRFCAGGRQLVVYGRPRRFSQPVPDLLVQLGRVDLTLDFEVLEPLVYDVPPDGTIGGPTHVVQLPTFVANTAGGVLFDDVNGGADTEMWWDGGTTEARAGVVDNTSIVPTPFQVTIHGPISSPVVWGDGWRIAFTGRGGLTIPYDRSITVDTRTRTALWDTGQSVAGHLSRDSRLTALLQPGLQELHLSGQDQTGTSTVTISWATAARSIAR